jgi:hypothetical protein
MRRVILNVEDKSSNKIKKETEEEKKTQNRNKLLV